VTPDSLDTLSKLVWFFDEPFADSSALPTYYVSQLTRQHVTVALTGDGGDELFAGYPRYQTIERLGRFDRLPILIRRMATGPWVDWIPSGPQRSIRQRLKHRLQILRDPASRRYVNWLTEFPRPLRASFYQPGIAAMRTDMTTYLPDDLLVKVDITSMAHGLEARSPFLDHHVVELVGKIPFDLLATRGKIKPLLTTVFSDLIPHELQSRPKMGFSVPLDRWFRDDLHGFARETLMASDAFCHRYFRAEAIRTLLDQHQSHHWNHGDRIWSLLFFELWGKALTLRPRLSPRSAPAIASR
jgi:asparagine synthase (glutamine-hydrolysing)